MKAATLALAAACLCAGCGSGKGTFTFESLAYPASMTQHIGGPDGAAVDKRDLRTVGKLELEQTFWGIAYGWVQLTGDTDVGAALNQQVAERGGDGVVGLAASAKACGINVVPLLNWLPIWPGCVTGKLTGEIVKYAPGGKLATSPAGAVRVVGPEALAKAATELLDARLAAFPRGRVVTKEAPR